MGKSLQMDMETTNKTQPSCARVKVLVDLNANLPMIVKMEIYNENPRGSLIIQVKIHYDHLPKYFFEYKIQGHNMENCWYLHHELRQQKKQQRNDFPPKMLVSRRIIGDPEIWKEIKNKKLETMENKKAVRAAYRFYFGEY